VFAKSKTVVTPPWAAATDWVKKSFAVERPEKVVLDVHVRLDPAREDEQAGRVDGPRRGAARDTDDRDPAVLDRDVGPADAGRRDRVPAPDDQVVHAVSIDGGS
jgi:hypothetical protein